MGVSRTTNRADASGWKIRAIKERRPAILTTKWPFPSAWIHTVNVLWKEGFEISEEIGVIRYRPAGPAAHVIKEDTLFGRRITLDKVNIWLVLLVFK
jgi:hypothetical protein